jgi:oligogalacturonide lyase
LPPAYTPSLRKFELTPTKEIGGMQRQLLWLMNMDGKGLKPFFQQKKQWLKSWEQVGHQAWLPDGESMLFMSRRDKIKIISLNDEFGKEKPCVVKEPNLWHPNPSFQGDLVVFKAMWKDTGLWLVDVKTRKKFNLCLTKSDAVNPEAYPQSSHPHPSFSPDGKVVIFNLYLLETGAQIYSCELLENRFA